jgi:energy-coupling factor transporter ATP-binding protein EcfA2
MIAKSFKPSPKSAVVAVVIGEAALYGYSEILGNTVNGLALAGGAYTAYKGITAYKHHRSYIRPLHRALSSVLELPDDVSPRKYIKIPADYHEQEQVGRIELPAHYWGENQATVARIVNAKLGLSDVGVTFHLEGRKPHMTLRRTKRPPQTAFFTDPGIRELMESAKESAPLIGVGHKLTPVSSDLDVDAPHILICASAGGGKSTLIKSLSSQILHNGGNVVVLDFKRHSQKWMYGLPGVLYAKDISHIHDTLVKLGHEGHVRNLIIDEWEGEEGEEPIGTRLLLILEEMNATKTELANYWKAVRKAKADEDGPADPKDSPAITALRAIMFMGRTAKMHVLMTAQSATANAVGGTELRENFYTRIMARYTVNAWKMLAPQVTPVPRMSTHNGRMQVVKGSTAYETQALYLTTHEAREWATSGIPCPSVDLDGGMSRDIPSQKSRSEASVTRDVTDEPRYTLAEIARREVVPITADNLRQLKRRDDNFPPGEGGKYTEAEIRDWYAINR